MMVVQLNDSGQVVQKVSSKSKGNVNIDCIYKVLKLLNGEPLALSK